MNTYSVSTDPFITWVCTAPKQTTSPILSDLTERQLQNCVKVGLKADIAEAVDGHISRDGCDDVTTKNEGWLVTLSPEL